MKNLFTYSLLDNNITGENFRNFITYCLKNSVYFSLTLHNYERKSENLPPDSLAECFYKKIETYLWYRFKTYESPLTVVIYYSNISMVDNIMDIFTSLFKSNKIGIEDLCFFSNDKFLFGSVTHEKFAELFLSNDAEVRNFEAFTRWERTTLLEKEYESIPDTRLI